MRDFCARLKAVGTLFTFTPTPLSFRPTPIRPGKKHSMSHQGGYETDARPSPQSLAVLAGADADLMPNNFVLPRTNVEVSINSSSSTVNNSTNTASSSTIKINNASNFQIGNTFAFNFSKPKKKKTKNGLSAEALAVQGDLAGILMKPDLQVTTKKIKNVKIGAPWRFVMRHLKLTDAEIDNKHEEYINKGGIEEVIYQLLRLWIEKNGSGATLHKFAMALHKEGQIEALETLTKLYAE